MPYFPRPTTLPYWLKYLKLIRNASTGFCNQTVIWNKIHHVGRQNNLTGSRTKRFQPDTLNVSFLLLPQCIDVFCTMHVIAFLHWKNAVLALANMRTQLSLHHLRRDILPKLIFLFSSGFPLVTIRRYPFMFWANGLELRLLGPEASAVTIWLAYACPHISLY